MAFVNPNTPNLPDYLTWLGETVQIPLLALPTNSAWPGYAFNQALLIVNPCIGGGILYPLAVYNLATAILFQITPDQSGQTYFEDARSAATSDNFPAGGYGLIITSMGLVTSASDEGTSSTLKTPDWAANLTIGQLTLFKTPWGAAYLAYAQSYGSVIVGLT